jgi:starch-binding outer membrane protein, SusD/RagB family
MNMKPIKYFLIVSFLFSMSACDEDLQLYPLNQISEGSFYNNQLELQQAVNDVYRQLGRLADARSVADLYGELYSDNTYIAFQLGGTPVDDPISRHEIRPSNDRILTAWNNTYNSIYICNNLIYQLENTKVAIDQSLKSRWMAEALLVRSFAYFNLVRAFGDIPLITQRISPTQAYDYLRESDDKVYEQLIADLTFAKNNLPTSYTGKDVGRVTKYGASALLAKVYLTMGNKAAAQTELEFIINSNQFSLDANNDGTVNKTDYLHIFAPGTKNSKSSILEAQYLAGPNAFNSNHQTAYAPYHHAFHLPGITAVFRGGGVNSPTADLVAEFEEGDPRQEVTVYPGYVNQGTGDFVEYPFTMKFFDPIWTNPGQNFEIIRYADILLMYAEVTGNAQYLNMVRARVGLPPFGSAGYPSNLYPTLDLAIEHERRVELALEMHRFFDLARTGRAAEVMQGKETVPGFSGNRLLFPIPEYAIDVNPDLTQNQGYD